MKEKVVVCEVAFQGLLAAPQLAATQKHHLRVHQLRHHLEDHLRNKGRPRRPGQGGGRGLLQGQGATRTVLLEGEPGAVLSLLLVAALAVALRLLRYFSTRELGNGVLKGSAGPLEVLRIDGQRQELKERLLPHALADTVLEAPKSEDVVDACQVVALLPVCLLGFEAHANAKDCLVEGLLGVKAPETLDVHLAIAQLLGPRRPEVQGLRRKGEPGAGRAQEPDRQRLAEVPGYWLPR
mmetsp:Transcript_107956/g.301010  ORF Transcript_107956/g.301010 Transcript_107956/m.301010 type:complete len:238 (-) Transcript_107956:110-823(-)